MKKAIKRIAALAMALTIAGAGTSASEAFSANVLTAEAATVSANSVSANTLKRAEFVRWIYQKAEKPDVKDHSVFSDLPDSSPYAKPVMWAYKNGIVSGYPGGKFGVNDPITVEQAVQILFNHAWYVKRDIRYTIGSARKYNKSQWAQNTHSLDWGVNHNILTVNVCPNYDATKPATPGACKEMLRRYERNIIMK